jgi:hypothetical protein
MRAVLTEPFAANLIASPPEVQKAFGKQLTGAVSVSLDTGQEGAERCQRAR